MKKAVLLYLILFPVVAFAQFPAPDSFKIDINYILMGNWDLCDGKVLEGPAYCNYFHWQAPDTANTPATLAGYRIYKDDEFFLSTANTSVDSAGMYLHASFYVTAVYENPAGESGPSNVVVIEDLPMGVNAIFQEGQIEVRFDPVRQMLVIRGAEYVGALWVYNMQGGLVLFTDVVSAYQRLEGLTAGAYMVVVQDKYGGIISKIVAMGF